MLGSDLCDFSDTYIFMKRDITFTDPNNVKKAKALHFKTMHHISIAFKKLTVYKLTTQKIWAL